MAANPARTVGGPIGSVDPAGGVLWQVRLLGAVEAHGPGGHLSRWPSRAAALLLARLALAPDRIHPREELVDMLWPGAAMDVGRNRLRQVLSTLKSLLEAGGGAAVIEADRLALRVVPGALACDARDFERHLRAGAWEEAAAAWRGDLLPGFYDDWVVAERGRLSALAERLETMPQLPAPNPRAQTAPPAPTPGQLPGFWTRLFGTELSATRLRDLVRHQRLVTVFGAGGSGKTRLAVEAARALQDRLAWAPEGGEADNAFDRVAFVSLVDCSDSARAVDAIASALQVTGGEPLAGIAAGLAGQRTLLVLDNFEQLVGLADAVVLRLLTDTPTLHVLVTSRQRLGMDGEQVFELAGLSVDRSPDRSADAVAASAPAVALFVDRARAAAPDFVLNPAQGGAVLELVRLLSGMPLAIELAASRMRSLSPQALLALLTDGAAPMLDLLARDGKSDGMAQRHASMRHVVAWSWQQLSPPLVALMGALAAFAAPALGDTVAAVAGLDAHTARDRLEQLRDHSLVVAHKATPESGGGAARYVLLQPVREFVVERTDAATLAQARERLRRWLIDFGHQCAAHGHAALMDVEAELPQVYAAILGAAADGPAARGQAVAIAVALRRHWEVDTRAGLPRLVAVALEAALADVAGMIAREQRCDASMLLCFSHMLAGFSAEALALADQALALATDPRRRALALLRRANASMFSKQDHGAHDAPLAEALALAREAGDLEAQGLALRMQFLLAVNRDDDHVAGEKLAQQVQSLWEQLGHRRNAYSGLMDRATCWIAQGRLDEAATALAACEQVALQERYATGAIMSSWQLGRVSIRLRQADAALAAFKRCLQGAWDHKRMAYLADALVLVPGGLAFAGHVEDAARLQGFAVAHWQRHFGAFYRDLERDVRPTRRWLRQRLGAVRFEALRLEGACMPLPDAVGLGLGSGRTAA